MKNEITSIKENSIAEEIGLEIGDALVSVNGKDINDIIDYKFLITDEFVVLDILKQKENEVWTYEIEKEYDEDLGLEFATSIMDNAKSCFNNCVFCFIDQLPKGMRKTLYFKDDDSRLSFLQGNFVTLTNMKDADIDRIIEYKISPINISVHTTNPDLRVKMLKNRFAGNIMERLRKLSKAGITMNCQIVSIPGINDGKELTKTVKDLYEFYPSIRNIAVVPVGLTKFRDNLEKLEMYNKQTAAEILNLASELQNNFMQNIGEPFVRLSDEFYVIADIDVPNREFYGDFEQLEDGVGMIRHFRDAINETISQLNPNVSGKISLICGDSAFKELEKAAKLINSKNYKLQVNVIKVINEFFGSTITVSGLITGTDIINTLKTQQSGDYIIIPNNMLKKGEDIFLDDVTLVDLQQKLNKKVIVCNYEGDNLIEVINNLSTEE